MQRLLAETLVGVAAILSFTLQSAAAPVTVIGSENVIHTVEDMNKTYAFYHGLGVDIAERDVMGREQAKKVPAPGPSSDSLDKLCDIPHTTWRYLAVTIPNAFNMELVEFNVPTRKKVLPANQDPGASTLVLTVRNVDKALEAAKKGGGTVVTVGGAPLRIEDEKSRSVFVRDPDGFFIELNQPDHLPETTAPPTSIVIGGSLARTVRNTDKTLSFYRDLFGFDVQAGTAFQANKTIADLVGVPTKAQFRGLPAKIPDSSARWEFIQFKDLPGKPFHPKIEDPGSIGFQLKVRDVDAAAKAVLAGGGTILTAGGEPLVIGKNRTVLAHDPDGFLLELMQNVGK